MDRVASCPSQRPARPGACCRSRAPGFTSRAGTGSA
jgi:hypothetical protein